ncbi:kinase-like domain-containing protein, partial [Mycena metata]
LVHESLIWRQLWHPNVVPFLGVCYIHNRLNLISPWIENGNFREFLNKNPDTNRFSLILDVALGLQYLHEQNVIHGNSKGMQSNILITASHRACISNFGLSLIVNETVTMCRISGVSHCRFWYILPTKWFRYFLHLSDTNAITQILTGEVPINSFPDMALMFEFREGKHPPRPTECSGTKVLDNLWQLMEDCWNVNAELRPTAPQIVERL